MPVALLFAMGAGFSHNYGTLCVLRFFTGLFSSPSLSVGGGIIADMLPPIHRSTAMACWIGVALVGTSTGPVLSGFAVQNKGWRWSQWVFIFVTLTGFIPSLFMSESYKKIILARRARARSRSQPGVAMGSTERSATAAQLQSFTSTAMFFLTVTLFRPFVMLVREPIVAAFSIYHAVLFSVLFSFFEVFPIVFGGVYGFNVGTTGISFLGIVIGVIIGIGVQLAIDRHFYYKKTLARQAQGDFTSLPPEERLYAAMVGAPLISIGLFWFGWSSRADVHWISSEIATVVFGVGAVGVSAPCLQYRKFFFNQLVTGREEAVG
jgi:MFS family permease